MALELKISEQSYDNVTATAIFADTTGSYDATLNPGGYGAPNDARASLYNVLSVKLSNDSGEETSYIDPNTDSTYSYKFGADGSYKINLCSIEFEAGAYDVSLMPLGRVFYSAVDDTIYKVTLENSVNVLEETSDVYSNNLNVSEDLHYLVNSFAEEKSVDFFCASCDCGGLRDEYNDIKRAIDSMTCNFNQGHYDEVNNVANFSRKIRL